METRVGFIGLGIMGRPMAANLQRAGIPLSVWNRSPGGAAALASLGAVVHPSPTAVFEASDVVLLMLALRLRSTRCSSGGVTRSRGWCRGARSCTSARPRPASPPPSLGTSRRPAVTTSRRPSRARASRRSGRRLVGLVAGRPEVVDRVAPLLAPMCREVVRCGEVPAGTGTKARRQPLPLHDGRRARRGLPPRRPPRPRPRGLPSRPRLRSDGERGLDGQGSPRLVARDFEAQAAVRDVHTNTRLIADAAGAVGAHSPVLEATREPLQGDRGRRARRARHGGRRHGPGAAGCPHRRHVTASRLPGHTAYPRGATAASAGAGGGRGPPRRAAAPPPRTGSPAARRGCRAGPRRRARRRPSRRRERPRSAA